MAPAPSSRATGVSIETSDTIKQDGYNTRQETEDTKMKTTKRKWTPEMRKQVIDEYTAAPNGAKHMVLEKHKVSSGMLANWKYPGTNKSHAKVAKTIKDITHQATDHLKRAHDALIYLKHAKKLMKGGPTTRAELLALLALDTLQNDDGD